MSDVSKLPKWAQEKIAGLERELIAVRANLDAQRKPPGLVSVVDYVHGHWGLEDTATVRFEVPYAVPRRRSTGWVDARRDHTGRVLIMGEDSIVVLPRSGNVVEIELRR